MSETINKPFSAESHSVEECKVLYADHGHKSDGAITTLFISSAGEDHGRSDEGSLDSAELTPDQAFNLNFNDKSISVNDVVLAVNGASTPVSQFRQALEDKKTPRRLIDFLVLSGCPGVLNKALEFQIGVACGAKYIIDGNEKPEFKTNYAPQRDGSVIVTNTSSALYMNTETEERSRVETTIMHKVKMSRGVPHVSIIYRKVTISGKNQEDMNMIGIPLGKEMKAHEGKVALHYAAKTGNVDLIRKLLVAGAKMINVRDRMGKTPLHYAAEAGLEDVVLALVDNGADVSLVDKEGRRASDYASEGSAVGTYLHVLTGVDSYHKHAEEKIYKSEKTTKKLAILKELKTPLIGADKGTIANRLSGFKEQATKTVDELKKPENGIFLNWFSRLFRDIQEKFNKKSAPVIVPNEKQQSHGEAFVAYIESKQDAIAAIIDSREEQPAEVSKQEDLPDEVKSSPVERENEAPIVAVVKKDQSGIVYSDPRQNGPKFFDQHDDEHVTSKPFPSEQPFAMDEDTSKFSSESASAINITVLGK